MEGDARPSTILVNHQSKESPYNYEEKCHLAYIAGSTMEVPDQQINSMSFYFVCDENMINWKPNNWLLNVLGLVYLFIHSQIKYHFSKRELWFEHFDLNMRVLVLFLLQLARGSPRSRCTPIEHSCSLEADGIVFHVKAKCSNIFLIYE